MSLPFRSPVVADFLERPPGSERGHLFDAEGEAERTAIPAPASTLKMQPGSVLTQVRHRNSRPPRQRKSRSICNGGVPFILVAAINASCCAVLSPPAIAEDYNMNGAVDAADFTVWQDTLGSTTDLRADGDMDGLINLADYEVWRSNFGSGMADGQLSGSPQLTITNLGPNQFNDLQWAVHVIPDPGLFTNPADDPDRGTGGSIALEIGFRVLGSNLTGVSTNIANFGFANPGNVIFGWETLTPEVNFKPLGVQQNPATNEVFAALGSQFFTTSTPKELLIFTTQGTQNTTIQWLGSYGGVGRLAQAGVNFDTAAGTVMSGPTLSTLLTSGIWTNDAIWSTPLHPNNGNGGLFYDVAISSGQVTIPTGTNIVIEGLTFSGGVIEREGSLTIQADAQWSGGTDMAGGDMTGSGQTTFNGTTTISGGIRTVNGSVINTGSMTWQGGSINLQPPSGGGLAELRNFGQFNLTGDGTVMFTTFPTANFVNEISGTLRRMTSMGTASIDVPSVNHGRIELHTGTLQFGSLLSNTETGTIAGNGVLQGDVNSVGRLAPGFSPGIIEINGNLILEGSSVVEIEVGGLVPGTEHDQLIVSGMAILGGRLDVPIIDDPVPPALVPGNEITILTANPVLGRFRSLFSPNFASVYPNLAIGIRYGPIDVRLAFVEPTFNGPIFPPMMASWFDPIWSAGSTPDSTNIVELQNPGPAPARVDVAEDDAFVHQLSVAGDMNTFTVGVKNGNTLSATKSVTIGNQGVIELGESTPTGATIGNLASAMVQVEGGGRLTGNGTIVGNLNVAATPGSAAEAIVSPGFSIGQLDVEGAYSQRSGGTLSMEVTGTLTGEFDKLNVAGSVELGGKLVFDASGFTGAANPDAPFTFLTAGSYDPEVPAENRFDEVETIGSSSVYVAVRYPAVLIANVVDDQNLGTGSLTTPTGLEGLVCPLGDMNCDGQVDSEDVPRFALALVDPDEFENSTLLAYGLFIQGNIAGDVDGFGGFDYDDIRAFVDLIPSGMGVSVDAVYAAIAALQQVPEPSSLLLVALASCLAAARRTRRPWRLAAAREYSRRNRIPALR